MIAFSKLIKNCRENISFMEDSSSQGSNHCSPGQQKNEVVRLHFFVVPAFMARFIYNTVQDKRICSHENKEALRSD